MKWAYDLSNFNDKYFKDLNNFFSIFIDFCLFCNIKLNNLQGVI